GRTSLVISRIEEPSESRNRLMSQQHQSSQVGGPFASPIKTRYERSWLRSGGYLVLADATTPSTLVAMTGPDLSAPAGPVRPRSRRREELLAVAANLFAARGFTNVTVDDIGAAAGVSGPALYHHF